MPPMPVLRLPGFQVWGTPTDGLSICLHLIRNQGRMGLLNPAIFLLAFKHLHVFFISSLSIFGLCIPARTFPDPFSFSFLLFFVTDCGLWINTIYSLLLTLYDYSEHSIHNLNFQGFEFFSSPKCYVFFLKTCLCLLWSGAETTKYRSRESRQCFITML